MAKTETIDRCLGMLAAMYPFHSKANGIAGATIAREVFIVEWSDIDDDLLIGAVLQYLSTKHEFHPSAGEIRSLAYQMLISASSAEEAWSEVKQAIHKYHLYAKPEFSSETIERAALAIGWEALCMQTYNDEPANRAHFMQIYRALQERKVQSDLMLPDVKASLEQLRKRHAAQELIGNAANRLTLDGKLSRLLKPGAK